MSFKSETNSVVANSSGSYRDSNGKGKVETRLDRLSNESLQWLKGVVPLLLER